MSANEKALVVGVNGFLGRNVASRLLAAGHEVTGVHRAGTDRIPDGVERVPHDALDSLEDGYAWVFVTAAHAPFGHLDEPDWDLVRSNVELPIRLCERFRTARIVFASTVAVYGWPKGTINESTAPQPANLYARTKLAGETVVACHPNHAIVRLGSLYGRGMRRITFLPCIVDDARDTGVITLFGDGSRRQEYLHVTDAADLCIAAARSTDNAILLGVPGRAWTNRAAAELVVKQLPGTDIRLEGDDATPSWRFDNTATRNATRFRPRITLEYGIRDVMDA